jgi:ABC-type Fe3+/spermidine/putrescine transport system ATPase subunit
MLNIQDVSFAYDETPVLRDVDLMVEQGEIICLLGASGSGKSTLLRLIAGLEQDYSGDIRLSGKSIKPIPVHQRGFGYMFQDFALFPHMTVSENVAFGLKMQSIPKSERQKRIDSALKLVGLVQFGERDVNQLSGGEKQRVALARSLAPQPRLLMLDEPLGSLDAGLRERLMIEVRDIIKQVGLTAIYVTHDQQEAYAVADRIAIMHKGAIVQVDTPQNLYHHPKTPYVARFLGFTNIFSPEVFDRQFRVDESADAILLHPDGLSLADKGKLQGKLIECIFRGDSYRLTVKVEDETLVFSIPSNQPVPSIGSTVQIHVEEEAIISLYNDNLKL